MPKIDFLVDKLKNAGQLETEEWRLLLAQRHDGILQKELAQQARCRCDEIFGRQVYLRGLIEFTNICRNDCYYCGIRRGNANLTRYRLTADDIINCTDEGHRLGFRTFVLQGGEDPYWSDEHLVPLVKAIAKRHRDSVITLSVGERTRESYQALYEAGARRFLLRHETGDEAHYRQLHPASMSAVRRKACLQQLKEIGYQTGCGFMVGSPGQTTNHLVKDFCFMQELQPHMVGIGPFLPHHDTPFAAERPGNVQETLFLLSLVRLMLPRVLLPATTALGTADAHGQEAGIMAGCNVIMPNLSPLSVRANYELYDGKRHSGSEAAESVKEIQERLAGIGYSVQVSRGDHPDHVVTRLEN